MGVKTSRSISLTVTVAAQFLKRLSRKGNTHEISIVNLLGSARVRFHFLDHKKPGVILNNSSVAGLRGMPRLLLIPDLHTQELKGIQRSKPRLRHVQLLYYKTYKLLSANSI